MTMRLRELTADELSSVRQLAHARAASARRVERAQIVWLASQG